MNTIHRRGRKIHTIMRAQEKINLPSGIDKQMRIREESNIIN
jgi:hypothetical protein